MSNSELPKSSLLRKSREFNRVYRFGQRLYGEGFAIIYASNDLDRNRLGMSVPKKVGTAVRRNRIKRIIREVFRSNRESFPPCADIVITVRPGMYVGKSTDFLQRVTAVLHAGDTKRLTKNAKVSC